MTIHFCPASQIRAPRGGFIKDLKVTLMNTFDSLKDRRSSISPQIIVLLRDIKPQTKGSFHASTKSSSLKSPQNTITLNSLKQLHLE